MELTNPNNEENKFKCLLEYFVTHLEYVVTKKDNSRGFEEYIKPIIDEFTENTMGIKNPNKVQNQIKNWSKYSLGDISISVKSGSGTGYMSDACYLHWADSRVNIVAEWEKKKKKITHLSIAINEVKKNRTESKRKKKLSIEELGLFKDSNNVNDSFKEFFEEYKKYYQEYKKAKENEQMENIKTLLINNHNIILHGAPGTGKTHLAKDVAKQLIFGEDEVLIDKTDEELGNDSEKIEKRNKQETQFKEQFDFVQFHQSYDYTDFVEGLRPKDDGKGNIGFERRDGIFKKFCEKAIQSMNGVDNFKESYEKLLNCVEEKGQIEIPSLSDSFFAISLQENKNGFVISLKNDKGEYQETSWGYINFDQCYNIYKGLPGIPSENQDNYRKAIVKYMKDNLDLKDYVAGKNEPFIFVIDEINRGEMSKIFGELFYSIDPGYRGKDGAIKTQYANLQEEPNEFDLALGINKNEVGEDEKKHDLNKGKYGHFFVPENVYIIGTMNDIDRSVESMDFAMRRRFAFKEITAEDSQKSMFGDGTEWKNGNDEEIDVSSCLGNIENRMDNLNNAILNKEFNLGQAYQIGGAYFLKFANYCKIDGNKRAAESQDEAFESLWKNHLEGVLREYLRGMDNVEGEDGKLKKLEKAYKLKDKYEKNGTIKIGAKRENQTAVKSDNGDGEVEQPVEKDV